MGKMILCWSIWNNLQFAWVYLFQVSIIRVCMCVCLEGTEIDNDGTFSDSHGNLRFKNIDVDKSFPNTQSYH